MTFDDRVDVHGSAFDVITVKEIGPQASASDPVRARWKAAGAGGKIKAVAPDDTDKKPRNRPLISSIESIRRAVARSFWTDPVMPFPTDDGEHWWEVWIRRAVSPEKFRRNAKVLGLHVASRELRFPDRIVFLIRASVAGITRSAELLNSMAELRRATPVDLEPIGLDLLDRAIHDDGGAIHVAVPRRREKCG